MWVIYYLETLSSRNRDSGVLDKWAPSAISGCLDRSDPTVTVDQNATCTSGLLSSNNLWEQTLSVYRHYSTRPEGAYP